MPYLNEFLFGIYPYIALGVFFLGSLIRFDREQYSWRSGSSQLLRSRQLRWGSNLFHVGVLFLLFGHTVGMLTPHWAYESFMTAGAKQVLAMVSGGIAGALALVGPDHPAASAPRRPAHPPDQLTHGHLAAGPALGAACAGDGHDPAVRPASRRQHDAGAGTVGTTHRDLPGRRGGPDRRCALDLQAAHGRLG